MSCLPTAVRAQMLVQLIAHGRKQTGEEEFACPGRTTRATPLQTTKLPAAAIKSGTYTCSCSPIVLLTNCVEAPARPRPPEGNPNVINGILWRLLPGAPWRENG